ncbi:DeoR/GlpR family DNA-binding transcription regulator [Polycladidibacter stylochi]|uniref:DeoR/GlpR family DNA-binding transcription regulator n=1 Tax=Polycladidibacter stylochi TaxID=1807766 RepID=UPI000833A6BE|nr:DeoR/GlpR family DNA-binding transcription regulator [Pseudovibrio stylochi]
MYSNQLLDLNNPEVRQRLLADRLQGGQTLVTSQLCKELGVSLATLRRDLLSLEAQGLVKRVRGGAVPLSAPALPYKERQPQKPDFIHNATAALAPYLHDDMVLLLDGGHSLLQLARALPVLKNLLIITPAPAVALVAMERNIKTLLIGGQLSPLGAVSVGALAERQLASCAADLCIQGTCAIDVNFGFSADDLEEASLRQQMAHSSTKTIVIADKSKLNRRARHQVHPLSETHLLITDAAQIETEIFSNAGLLITNV